MNNIRNILIGVIFSASSCFAQSNEPFEQRLAVVKQQLDVLSDSLAIGLNESANFSVSGISIQSFLRTLAESHDLNIQVDPSLQINLSNNFTSVKVKDILYFICQEYQLDIRFTNTILSFFKYQLPKTPIPKLLPKKINVTYDRLTGFITFDLLRDSLQSFVKEVTRISDRNVVASGGLEVDRKLLTGYMKDLPLENALDKLSYINGLKLIKSKDGTLILELANQASPNSPYPANPSAQPNKPAAQGDIAVKDSLITIDVVNFPIMDLINQVSAQLKINYIYFSEVSGNTTAKVRDIRYFDMLSFLFQGSNFTFKKRDNIYLIGQRTQEGFRSSELVKLDFRTIEGVEKEIPADLLKEIDLKIVRELNAFILTGNRLKIDELVSFIKMIDKPIPNILIEVIVAEANKNFSIETGLKAFLADSTSKVPKTSGTLFPGADITLSSQSINNALQQLDSKGIVNLGRVTPNFYATIKALETNNNIQVRSTPKLSTMNGSKANLIIGESQYYVEQTQNITGGVTPITTNTQRFNKVEANLHLTISPVVSGNEHITLDINAEFSNFKAPTIPNAPPGNTTRKFESKIRVKNEEVIVLGGIEQLTKSDGGSGLPLVARIPVIKWFFSSRTKAKTDNRLVVFIRPTIVY